MKARLLAPAVLKTNEHQEQSALFECFERNLHRYPELAWAYAVPNAAKRSPALAAYMKAEGMKRGVPDVAIPVSRGALHPQGGVLYFYHGLYVELKVAPNKPSPEQLAYHAYLNSAGYLALIEYGWLDAWENIENYLNTRPIREGRTRR